MRILILDDEKEIADLVTLFLKNEGYALYTFYEAAPALQCMEAVDLDLAILDVMLPGTDGFAVLKQIRACGHTFPVIMLTAKVEAADKITGLSIGADDYITKPFDPLELVSRVKAQLRRYTRYNRAAGADAHIFDAGGLVVNQLTHACILYDRPVFLTPTEFKIVWLLCENANRVVSTQEIFESVWGEQYLSSNNTVMVHIRRIREKLKEPARNPKFIKTVWGVGYKIEKR